MSRRQGIVAAIAALALLLLAGRAVSATWADYQWFAALGAADLWRRQALDALLARGAAFVLGTAFAAANIAGVRQSILLLVLPRRLGNLEIGEQVSPRTLNVAVGAAAALLGVGLAWLAPGGALVPYGAGGVPFRETDPYFARDLGFFVYRLPFEAAWYEWAVLVAAGVGVAVIVLYALTPALRWRAGQLRMSGWVRRHLTVLGAVVLALLAWGLRLDTLTLPVEGSGVDGMFTAIDHRLLVQANGILSLVTFAVSLVVLWAGWSGQLRLAFAGVSAVLAGALLVRGVLPIAGGRLVSPANETARDAPYRATRLSYTRGAYAVSAIRDTTGAAIGASPATALGGVPLWDPGAVRSVIERGRGGDRVIGDAGWTSGASAAMVLAVTSSGAEAAGTWHVLRVDPWRDLEGSGLPTFTEVPVAPVLVYPGANTPLVTDDPEGRIAAPPFRGMAARWLHAWALQRPQLLVRPEAGESAVLLTTRDVRDRVERLVPQFLQGSTVTPVVADDTLWWALELYSASASYPLSRRLAVPGGDVHYYRHAGTALVNATSGRLRVAARPDPDPLARTWFARLGGLVVRRDRLPVDLAAQLPPPVDGARAQATALALAGTRDEPASTVRRVPVADGADTVLTDGGATLWRMSDGRAAWSVPLVSTADTVTGLIVATGGELPVTRYLPLASGPAWGESLERLATTGRGGRDDARHVAGRVRVVPAGPGQLALVQPRFSWPVAGAPTLDGLVALVGGELKAGRTLAAIGGPADGEPSTRPMDAVTRQRLGPVYDRMRAALKAGDFAAFGLWLDQLGRALGRVPDGRRDP